MKKVLASFISFLLIIITITGTFAFLDFLGSRRATVNDNKNKVVELSATEKVVVKSRNYYSVENLKKVIPYYGKTDPLMKWLHPYSFYDDFDDDELEKKADKYVKKMYESKSYPDLVVSDYKNGICVNDYRGADYIFDDNKKMVDLVIPEKIEGKPVIRIGGNYTYDDNCEYKYYINPFAYCERLRSITLPATLKEISEDGLSATWSQQCLGRQYANEFVYVDENNPYYTSIDGILYTKDKKILLHIPARYGKSEINVPEGTKAFLSEIPVTVKTINIPESLVSFGEKLTTPVSEFLGCNFDNEDCILESINVHENNKYYSSENGVLYDKDKKNLLVYPACKKDKEYTAPESLEKLENIYFDVTKNLKTIYLNRNLKKFEVNTTFFPTEFPNDYTIYGYRNSCIDKAKKKFDKLCDDNCDCHSNNVKFKYLD